MWHDRGFVTCGMSRDELGWFRSLWLAMVNGWQWLLMISMVNNDDSLMLNRSLLDGCLMVNDGEW